MTQVISKIVLKIDPEALMDLKQTCRQRAHELMRRKTTDPRECFGPGREAKAGEKQKVKRLHGKARKGREKDVLGFRVSAQLRPKLILPGSSCDG